MHIRATKPMKSDTKIFIGAVIVSLVIIVGAVFALGSDNSPKRDEQGTASMAIDKKNEDFGSMKVEEEKSTTFTITNTSTSSPLRIWNIATSCDCTFATVVISGQETGEFNMKAHMGSALRNWIGEVAAGEKATMRVTYRPKVMPVQGPVTRQVTFSTNDPNNADVEISVSANVL